MQSGPSSSVLNRSLASSSLATITTSKVNAKRLAQAGFHPAPNGLESRHLLQMCPSGQIGKVASLRPRSLWVRIPPWVPEMWSKPKQPRPRTVNALLGGASPPDHSTSRRGSNSEARACKAQSCWCNSSRRVHIQDVSQQSDGRAWNSEAGGANPPILTISPCSRYNLHYDEKLACSFDYTNDVGR